MFGVLASGGTTVTYSLLNSDLISDISKVVTAVGTWFTSNPFLGMILTVSVVGLAITLIRSIRHAIM